MSPMSYNRWNYVKSNPINYVDPSGHFDTGPWCSDNISSRADAAEKYVNRTHAGHLIIDELNTYTAGGIGVQCRGTNVNRSLIGNSGEGIAQIADNWVKQEYGEKVIDWLGIYRGCGLTYEGEAIHDQNNSAWAVHYMRRVIQQVLERCDKCTATDKFIAAALAQNGPGFSHFELTQTVLNKGAQNPADLYRYLTVDGKVDTNRPDGVTVNWTKYFERRNNYTDTYMQLNLFQQIVWELGLRNWYIPNDLNWGTIREVATQ